MAIAGASVGFGLWGLAVLLELPESNELMLIISITVYAALIAIPVTFIHGVFRYGAFGVQTGARAAAALRSSSLLIGILYACAVAAPAVLLGHELMVSQAVALTVVMALVLQPVRSRAEAFVRRAVLGDRDRELTLLVQLGAAGAEQPPTWTTCSTSWPPPSATGCGPPGRASASSARRGSGPRRFRVAQAS